MSEELGSAFHVVVAVPKGWRCLDPRDAGALNQLEHDVASSASSFLEGFPQRSGRFDGQHVARLVSTACSRMAGAGSVFVAWGCQSAQGAAEPEHALLIAWAGVTFRPLSQDVALNLRDLLELNTSPAEVRADGFSRVLRIVAQGGLGESGTRGRSGPQRHIVEYLLPLFEPPAAAVLTCVTPSVQSHSSMDRVFDAMATTFRVQRNP